MTKSTSIPFILTLMYPFALEAETWSCPYQHGNEQHLFVRERASGGFRNPTWEGSSIQTILRENERIIHLYFSHEQFTTYFAMVLDKEDKKFSMVALDPGSNSDIIEGDCVVY